jgi:hypothetical protein
MSAGWVLPDHRVGECDVRQREQACATIASHIAHPKPPPLPETRAPFERHQ